MISIRSALRKNPNKLYVLFAEDGTIASFVDNNDIKVNGTSVGILNAQQTIDLSFNEGDIVEGTGPIIGAGEVGSSHFQYMPEYMKGKILQTSILRSNPTEIKIYGLEASTVEIVNNGAIMTTVTVPQGGVVTYTNNNNGAWRLNSDGYILAQIRTASEDPHPFVWGSDTIVGFASNSQQVSTLIEEATTTFTGHANINSVTSTEDGINTNNEVYSGTRNYEHPNSAVHTITLEGKRLFSHSYADSDGGCSSKHLPTGLMGHTFILPHGTEFVSFINRSGKVIEKYDPAGALISTFTPTKTNANNLGRYAYRDGLVNSSINIARGNMYVCEEKMYCVYQNRENTIYASLDDETVLLPTDLDFKP